MDLLRLAYDGRRALVTGHTGFKGAWLSLWLEHLGARVTGVALPPPTDPCLFALAKIEERIDHHVADIRNAAVLRDVVRETRPDVVFHLAAQSLVRASYESPLETLATNVMGTAHILDAVRALDRECAVVIVTSDKCYENREWVYGYREDDPLGGRDPYSMSKGCAELVTASWRESFFASPNAVRAATARAGNVIGGGDWAKDRIMVDCIAALGDGNPVQVRNPRAARPWQHVLEPLNGYLWLGAQLMGEKGDAFCEAWNFGPSAQSVKTAGQLVEAVIAEWGDGTWEDVSDSLAPHEATLLALCCDKAWHQLEWRPVWDFTRAVSETVTWYKNWHSGTGDLAGLCIEQIEAYTGEANAGGVKWAQTG